MLLTALLIALPPAPVEPTPDVIQWRKKTVLHFNDVLLNGELVKPSTAYLRVRRNARFRSLIRLRQNFAPELQASVDNL